MRAVKLHKGKLTLTDDIIIFFEKRVSKFGNGAKVDCPKEYLGKRVYIMVCEE